MPKNIPLTDDDKALIATEYAELKASGMAAGAIEDVLAAKFGINSRTIRNYRATAPLTSSDFEARESDEYVKGTSTLYDEKGNVKLRWVKADKARDTERFREWAICKYRYWLLGHIHHDVAREYQGVRVESFRTLAARDAWAASMGYQSGRDMKAIILHRKYGEVARHIVSVDMLRGQ